MQNTTMFDRKQDEPFAFMISKENDDRQALRVSQINFIPLKISKNR